MAALIGAGCAEPADAPNHLPFDSGTPLDSVDTGPVDKETADKDTADSDTADTDTACPLETWYPDADGDGFGDGSAPVSACVAPPGDLADNTDCEDASSAVHPGATETCADGIDSNCDGVDKACAVERDVSTAEG